MPANKAGNWLGAWGAALILAQNSCSPPANSPPAGDAAPTPVVATSSVSADGAAAAATDARPAPSATPPAARAEAKRSVRVRGRVVYLAAALERRFGVQSVPEARERVLALQTPEGVLYPLVEDVRGRAFRTDERLREFDVELLARRHPGSPALQVIRVFEIRGSEKYAVDYWCDVCGIAMFETGPCSCCQETNRLRKRVVKNPVDEPGED